MPASRRSRRAVPIAASFVLVAALLALPGRSEAISTNVVISQVYGGGGNSGATYTHDFIELFNRGASSASLAGWSVQYASATGTGFFGATTTLITPLPATSLAPGQYLLVQEAPGAGGTTPLPSPDLIDPTPIAMAATAGKVALVDTATPLGCNGGAFSSSPCSPAPLAQIVDLVGYGGANFFEGAHPTAATSNTTAAIREAGGCTETDDNSLDFSIGTPTPRNTISPLNPCEVTTNPSSRPAVGRSRRPRAPSSLGPSPQPTSTAPSSTSKSRT